MKICILTFLMFFSINFLFAQKELNDYLKGYENDESLMFQNRKMNYLNNSFFELPFIEKIEFRTETNDFDLQKQEYLIRVSPNSLRSIKTQKQYQETVKFMTKMEMEVVQGRALKYRYELIIKFLFQKLILDIKYKQQLLLNDKVILLQRSITLEDFDIMDLIEADDDLKENNRQVMDLENNITTLKNLIQNSEYSNKNINIDNFILPSVSSIKQNLHQIKPRKSSSHPILKVQSAKAYNRLLQYQWEEAKSKFSLSYLQAKYANNNDLINSFSKSISIGIGFDIPLANAGRLDLNELQLDILESESEYRKLNIKLNEQKLSTFNRLNNLIRKHELVHHQLENSQSEYVLKEYQKIAETPPKAIIKLREKTLLTELLLQNLKFNIYSSYIEYLDHSGLLYQEPIINYLTGNLTPLK